MIGMLEGTVTGRRKTSLIISVGGVGCLVNTPGATREAFRDGASVTFFTHLAVREDDLSLYGFPTQEELDLFELLITISGIGPRSALSVLEVADVSTIVKAIETDDPTYLTKVSGIGKKSAEKIVMGLRDKLGTLSRGTGPHTESDEGDAIEALVALGYSTREAQNALKHVSKEAQGLNEKIKEALKFLGK